MFHIPMLAAAQPRTLAMRSIDEHWMNYLRDTICQQGTAQREPIGIYRPEGFALLQKILGEIRREVTSAIFDWEKKKPRRLCAGAFSLAHFINRELLLVAGFQ